MSTNQLQERRGGQADGSSTRHCPWGPHVWRCWWDDLCGGGWGALGAGTVSPHVVMSGISVCGQGDQKKKMTQAQVSG